MEFAINGIKLDTEDVFKVGEIIKTTYAGGTELHFVINMYTGINKKITIPVIEDHPEGRKQIEGFKAFRNEIFEHCETHKSSIPQFNFEV